MDKILATLLILLCLTLPVMAVEQDTKLHDEITYPYVKEEGWRHIGGNYYQYCGYIMTNQFVGVWLCHDPTLSI